MRELYPTPYQAQGRHPPRKTLRDIEIVAKYYAGVGTGKLAEEYGISRQRIYEICKRAKRRAARCSVTRDELVIDPHDVAKLGKGDLVKGHEILNKWVASVQKEIAELKSA